MMENPDDRQERGPQLIGPAGTQTHATAGPTESKPLAARRDQNSPPTMLDGVVAKVGVASGDVDATTDQLDDGRTHLAQLPPDEELLRRWCEQFQSLWKLPGSQPLLETSLAEVPAEMRFGAFRTLLGAELDALIDRKTLPDVKNYLRRFPDYSDSIRNEFASRRIAEFFLGARLGEGGMGTVNRALNVNLNRLVALKRLQGRFDDRQSRSDRFQREMQAIGALEGHENVIGAYTAGQADGVYYLAMELVDGCDLYQFADRKTPVSIADACQMIRQAAYGLQHAKDHGLIHRDIKPQNLMLNRHGVVKVLDFGLAKLRRSDEEDSTGLTGSGCGFGTPDYMAPEQAGDAANVSIEADIYSLGCTLFFLLAGHTPYPAPAYKSKLSKLKAHLSEPIPDIRQARPEVPAALAQIVNRMLAKLPEQRYPLPIDVAEALEPFCAGHDLRALIDHVRPGRSPRTVGSKSSRPQSGSGNKLDSANKPEAWPQLRRWPLFTAAVAVAMGVAVLVASWLFRPPAVKGVDISQLQAALPAMASFSDQWWFEQMPWYHPQLRLELARGLRRLPAETSSKDFEQLAQSEFGQDGNSLRERLNRMVELSADNKYVLFRQELQNLCDDRASKLADPTLKEMQLATANEFDPHTKALKEVCQQLARNCRLKNWTQLFDKRPEDQPDPVELLSATDCHYLALILNQLIKDKMETVTGALTAVNANPTVVYDRVAEIYSLAEDKYTKQQQRLIKESTPKNAEANELDARLYGELRALCQTDIANFYYDQSKYDESAKYLRRISRGSSDEFNAYADITAVYTNSHQKSFSEAARMADNALAALKRLGSPGHPLWAYYNMQAVGWSKMELMKVDEAQHGFEAEKLALDQLARQNPAPYDDPWIAVEKLHCDHGLAMVRQYRAMGAGIQQFRGASPQPPVAADDSDFRQSQKLFDQLIVQIDNVDRTNFDFKQKIILHDRRMNSGERQGDSYLFAALTLGDATLAHSAERAYGATLNYGMRQQLLRNRADLARTAYKRALSMAISLAPEAPVEAELMFKAAEEMFTKLPETQQTDYLFFKVATRAGIDLAKQPRQSPATDDAALPPRTLPARSVSRVVEASPAVEGTPAIESARSPQSLAALDALRNQYNAEPNREDVPGCRPKLQRDKELLLQGLQIRFEISDAELTQ